MHLISAEYGIESWSNFGVLGSEPGVNIQRCMKDECSVPTGISVLGQKLA
jgi:hypothetical protein